MLGPSLCIMFIRKALGLNKNAVQIKPSLACGLEHTVFRDFKLICCERVLPLWSVTCPSSPLFRQYVFACVSLRVTGCLYMSPQQGSLLLDCSSSGALSFSSGGSPLAGVKYTWLGEAASSTLWVSWCSGWA